jgi:hypothetical protein
MPQPSNGPVGGGSNPQHNPIQAFGPLGAKGQLNGNAAFGQKNSPDSLKTAGITSILGGGAEKQPGWYGPEGLVDVGGAYRYGHTHGVDVVDQKPGWLRRIFDRDPYVLREDVPKYKRKLKAIRGMHVMEQPHRLEFSHMGQLKPEMRQLIEAALAKNAGYKPALEQLMSIDYSGLPDPNDLDLDDDERTKSAGSSPAWQRSEGKNPEGGLNEKGRKSYEKAHGGNLKPPVTESNPSGERKKRQNSFCARMCGMKRVNTGSKTKSDPDSRINKSLRKWNCKCGSAQDLAVLAGVTKNAGLNDIYRAVTDPVRKRVNAAIRKAVLAAGIGGGVMGFGGAALQDAVKAPPVQAPAAVQQMAQQAAPQVAQQPLRLTAKDIKPAAPATSSARAPKAQPVTPAVIHAPGPVQQGALAVRAPEIKAAPDAVKKVLDIAAPKSVNTRVPQAILPPGPPQLTNLPKGSNSALAQFGPAAALTALGSGLGAYQAPQGHKTEGATRGGLRGAATGLGGVGGATLAGLASSHPLARLGGGLAGAALGYGGSGAVLGKPSWKNNA